MPRALFSKTGNAIWISHLDLMRLFQRAFQRAGLPLKHSQGFNPRPMVSIALPLSVGVSSECELLDFDLDGELMPPDEIMNRLNSTLTDGVRILAVYENGQKIRELALLKTQIILEYDRGIPNGAKEAIWALFSKAPIIVEKKGKSGLVKQDIFPMIRDFAIEEEDHNTLLIRAVICCQNPSLNPLQLVAAVERYLPAYRPDFARSHRVELYTQEEKIFR